MTKEYTIPPRYLKQPEVCNRELLDFVAEKYGLELAEILLRLTRECQSLGGKAHRQNDYFSREMELKYEIISLKLRLSKLEEKKDE